MKHNKSLSSISHQKSFRNNQSLNNSFINQMEQSFITNNNIDVNQNVYQDKIYKINEVTTSTNNDILYYKKCLKDIEQILDTIYEKGQQSKVDPKQQIPLGQKMKMNLKFNVRYFQQIY